MIARYHPIEFDRDRQLASIAFCSGARIGPPAADGLCPMSDQLVLQIDLDRVAANLSASREQAVTPQGAEIWLLENGFEPSEGNWIAEMSVASLLNEGEVISARSLDDPEGENTPAVDADWVYGPRLAARNGAIGASFERIVVESAWKSSSCIMVNRYHSVEFERGKLSAFCRRHNVQRLSLFGSILRSDFRPGSDIDVLVEFEEGQIPSLMDLGGMQVELSEMLGREVDLKTPHFLSQRIRQRVMSEAVVQYAA